MKTEQEAQAMVWAIHSAIEHIDRVLIGSHKDSVIRSLAEAAYAYDGGWLTRLDYGNVKPGWMSDEMWGSLADPDPRSRLAEDRD